MDHIVYVDHKAKELEKIIDGSKSMLIRAATGRKLPYGRVDAKDILYLIRNNGEGLVRAKCVVKSVFNSQKLSVEESTKLIEDNQEKLQLTDVQFKRCAGRRYVVLIEIHNVQEIEPFKIDRSNFSNMDDWLAVEKIESVKGD